MKATLIILICSLTGISVIAQQANTTINKSKRKKKEVYELVDHVVKLNVPSLLFKTVALQYEKKLSRSKTFTLGFIYRPKSAAPFSKSIEENNNGGLSLETVYMIKTARYSTFMFTPEFRFYFRKKAPRGLYLAPFLRYKNEGLTSNFQYQENNQSSAMKIGEYRYSANAFGAGVLFGLQVLTRKKMVIDFWFIGPWFGANYASVSSKLNTAALDVYQKAYIETVTEQFSELFGMGATYNWNATGFKNTNNGTGLGIRMFGINFGYSF